MFFSVGNTEAMFYRCFAVLLLALAMMVCCALPAFAAGTIEVTEDVSVSDDYDWTRFKGQNVAINVYNWGEYISNGSDDSVDVVARNYPLPQLAIGDLLLSPTMGAYTSVTATDFNGVPRTPIIAVGRRARAGLSIRHEPAREQDAA